MHIVYIGLDGHLLVLSVLLLLATSLQNMNECSSAFSMLIYSIIILFVPLVHAGNW